MVDSLGASCGNPCHVRKVLPVVDWQTVVVIEKRIAVVDEILDSEFLCTRCDSHWPRLSKPTHREAMRQMVREGINHCDRLADLEAAVIGGENLDQSHAPPLPLVSVEHDFAHRLGLMRRHVHTGMRAQAEINKEIYVRWRVRGRQRQYLVSLDTRQLLCIALLLRLAGERLRARIRQRFRAAHCRTFVSGINEVIMRHGSWFLSTWNSKSHACSGSYSHAFDLGMAAVRDLRVYMHRGGVKWNGVGQDELSVVLDKELRRRLGSLRQEDIVETQAMMRVDEMIRGPQTTRPVTFMFAGAPSDLINTSATRP